MSGGYATKWKNFKVILYTFYFEKSKNQTYKNFKLINTGGITVTAIIKY